MESDTGGLTPYSGQPSWVLLSERRDSIIPESRTHMCTHRHTVYKIQSGTFFLLCLLSGMLAACFASHFTVSVARLAPSSTRGPFSRTAHRRSTARTLDLRKGFDLLGHDTFVIICSGKIITREWRLLLSQDLGQSKHVNNRLGTLGVYPSTLCI